MVVPRTLGMLRVAVSMAALGCALPAWAGSRLIQISAIVVSPSQCRFGESVPAAPPGGATDAASDAKARTAYRCVGAAASTVSWSVSSIGTRSGRSQPAADATARLAGTGASADLNGLVGNDADTLVVTITP